MNMVTGEQETNQLQTTADGSLTVLAGSGAPDVALAVVRSGDPG